MSLPISQIGSALPTTAGTSAAGAGQGTAKLPFADLVKGLVQDTNQQQKAVETSVQGLVTGETESIHDVAFTASQADLAFRLVMEVRDRLLSSYQEVMRMQM